MDVTGTDPEYVDVTVVNCGDAELELSRAVPLLVEASVLELCTTLDGTCTTTVPSRLRAGSGSAIVDVSAVEPV